MTSTNAAHAGDRQPEWKPEYKKAFLISSGAGAAFGFFAALLFQQFVFAPPMSAALFAGGIALASGLLSGLSGLGATWLEARLLRWGMQKAHLRAMISFLCVALANLSVTWLALRKLGVFPLVSATRNYALWGTAAGLGFGAIFAIVGYRSEMIRQKMQLLELQNRHLTELASREELLQEAARNLAVAKERNRVARELHDSISQGMHGIVYALRSLRDVLQNNERGLLILDHLEETAAETLKELRSLVNELTPSPLEEHGFVEALRLHCELFARRQQLALELKLDYSSGLQPDQEAALYRIVQEALGNIQKHACATDVWVMLTQEPRQVTLEVRDNGRGFDLHAVTKGHGLNNMTARAMANGGALQIESQPGAGTTIKATLPLLG